MEGLREFFSGLFALCALCALCDMLTDFTGPKLSRMLKLVCSLALLFMVVTTCFESCEGIKNIKFSMPFDLDTVDNEAYSSEFIMDGIKTELENSLSLAIYEKFGIKPHNVSIDFITEAKDGITEVSVSNLEITLPRDTDSLVASSVKVFADGLFGIGEEVYGKGGFGSE